MGNNIGGGRYKKAAKIMKINGEYFKLKTPSKVIDIIKDYPHHILLDSDDFLRFNLRAKPLDLHFTLQPNKIYLLFELPKLPQDNNISNNNNNNSNESYDNVVDKSPLRRVRSGVEESIVTNAKELRKIMMTRRSISDLSTKTKTTVGGGGGEGPTRVKVRLPKGQVRRIMEESNDDVEVAQRILRLFATVDGGDAVVEGGGEGGGGDEEAENGVVVEEENEVDRHCFDVHGMNGSYQRKGKKLSL